MLVDKVIVALPTALQTCSCYLVLQGNCDLIESAMKRHLVSRIRASLSQATVEYWIVFDYNKPFPRAMHLFFGLFS